jgi:hypothetical protein
LASSTGDELVENGLDPHEGAGDHRLRPGDADQPTDRRHRVAEQALQRYRLAADLGQHAHDRIGEVHQGDQDDQHGADVEQ